MNTRNRLNPDDVVCVWLQPTRSFMIDVENTRFSFRDEQLPCFNKIWNEVCVERVVICSRQDGSKLHLLDSRIFWIQY